MNVSRQSRINSGATFGIGRKAARSDDEAFGSNRPCLRQAAGRFLNFNNPAAAGVLFKTDGLTVETECGACVSNTTRHREHITSSGGVTGHCKATRMQSGFGCKNRTEKDAAGIPTLEV